MITNENINYLWSSLIIEELIRNKVTDYIISPGSRSAPLTVAAYRHPKAQITIAYDERGAAYFALGKSRATQKPSVLICTSGTAIANYFPAVIEAYMDSIPLIVLSADRPPELIDSGANQTIDQINIFGKYSIYFHNLPCPNEKVPATYILSTIDQALQHSRKGPVHINCPYREPLAPKKQKISSKYLLSTKDLNSSANPYSNSAIFYDYGILVEKHIDLFRPKNAGFIIAGRLMNKKEAEAVINCAQKLNWPVFADITSQVKINSNHTNLIHNFDLLLEDENLQNQMCRRPVIHFGGQYVSKRLLTILKNHREQYIQINPFEKRIDPNQNVTLKITGPVESIAHKISELGKPAKENFLSKLQRLEKKTAIEIDRFLDSINGVNEIALARDISALIPQKSSLFLASSMPIRDMDMFSKKENKNIFIASNRGTSGIDGNIASALGFASAVDSSLTLVIGDLAFIHDLNSLTLLRNFSQNIIIILINNRGGGIFSFLPIAEHKDVFEPVFGTPHKFSFEKTSEQFNMEYFRPETRKEFKETYLKVLKSKKNTLIEIQTKRDENFLLHKNLLKKLKLSIFNA